MNQGAKDKEAHGGEGRSRGCMGAPEFPPDLPSPISLAKPLDKRKATHPVVSEE